MSTKSYLDEKKSALRFLMRALAYRNYRLFFGGQGLSLIGTWMQQIAMSWLVYRMTNSVFLLGLIGFTGQIPYGNLRFFCRCLCGQIEPPQFTYCHTDVRDGAGFSAGISDAHRFCRRLASDCA